MRAHRWIWAVVIAGCVAVADQPSPTDPHPAVTSTSSPVTTLIRAEVEGGLSAFRECMSSQGIEVGEVPLDLLGRPLLRVVLVELDITDDRFVSALANCASTLSTGALDLSQDPEMRALVVGRLERFSECVRERGVSAFPDPFPGFSGVGLPYQESLIPWDDDRLGDAVVICSVELLES